MSHPTQSAEVQKMPVIRTLSGVENNVLITGTFSMGKDRNGSHTMVLITGVLITGVLITGFL